ncbi:MAG: AmmeMemoRadiSam system protein A, partial [Bdellovibrionales bacterium]|nr:AmmeMemoRadiSam system protein A [Bdellovibrionales bacterium]
MKISAADSKWLLQFARRAILSRWSRETMVEALGDRVLATDLHAPGACFVTLEEMGELRGCIGSLIAHRPLYEDVWENAQAAAFDDPRFTPVKAAELELVSISISI